jgi:hypothetical protein
MITMQVKDEKKGGIMLGSTKDRLTRMIGGLPRVEITIRTARASEGAVS